MILLSISYLPSLARTSKYNIKIFITQETHTRGHMKSSVPIAKLGNSILACGLRQIISALYTLSPRDISQLYNGGDHVKTNEFICLYIYIFVRCFRIHIFFVKLTRRTSTFVFSHTYGERVYIKYKIYIVHVYLVILPVSLYVVASCTMTRSTTLLSSFNYHTSWLLDFFGLLLSLNTALTIYATIYVYITTCWLDNMTPHIIISYICYTSRRLDRIIDA